MQIRDDQYLLLLQPIQQDSIVDRFLKGRGSAAVMGVSLEVANLETVAKRLEQGAVSTKQSYGGVYGASLLVPAADTRGLWIEFVARSNEGISERLSEKVKLEPNASASSESWRCKSWLHCSRVTPHSLYSSADTD